MTVKVTIKKDGNVTRVLYMNRVTAIELALDYERRGIEVEVLVELI